MNKYRIGSVVSIKSLFEKPDRQRSSNMKNSESFCKCGKKLFNNQELCKECYKEEKENE